MTRSLVQHWKESLQAGTRAQKSSMVIPLKRSRAVPSLFCIRQTVSMSCSDCVESSNRENRLLSTRLFGCGRAALRFMFL